MIKADTLRAHQDELLRCVSSREKLLRQIHGITLGFKLLAEDPSPATRKAEPQDHGLPSFLEANNILKNRYFDPSTLPHLPQTSDLPFLLQRNKKSRLQEQDEEAFTDQNEQNRTSRNVLEGTEEVFQEPSLDISPSQGIRLSPPLREKSEALKAASQTLTNHDDATSAKESATQRPKSLAQSSDHIGFVDSSTREISDREQNDGIFQLSHLISEDVRPGGQEDADGRHGQDGSKDRDSRQISGNEEGPGNGLTPPDSGRMLVSSQTGDHAPKEGVGSSLDGSLKSQGKLARVETFAGTPTTPDEQLRLEEAQSMQSREEPTNAQGSSLNGQTEPDATQTASDLPSQFVQDDLDDTDNVMNAPLLSEHTAQSLTGFPNDDFSPEAGVPARPAQGLSETAFPGMNGDASRDLTFSRRPPMRIDTGVPSTSDSSKANSGAKANTAASTSEVATPSKAAYIPQSAQSPPERMTTRVSSGALRHKSVSEILGETPKSAPSTAEKAFQDASRDEQMQTPKSSTSLTSPDPAAFKLRLSDLREKEKEKEKERSKLSRVVFPKPQPSSVPRSSESTQVQRPDIDETPIESRDYLLTLYTAQVCIPPRATPLNGLLKSAHKILTTMDHYTDFREKQDCRILSKVYEMQANHRWSLRQLERSVEQERPVSHWDVLLGQMRWMRTDFREERKFKFAVAKSLADACATWFNSSADGRKSLQVKVRQDLRRSVSGSVVATPDLIHTAEDEASEATEDDFPRAGGTQVNAPAAIFSLPPDMFIFGLNKSPVAEKLLLELPLYEPSTVVQDAAVGATEISPDTSWKKPIVPVSKFAQGKIVSRDAVPPSKKSRNTYDYDDKIDPDIRMHDVEPSISNLRPEQDEVALFNPENKHVRDRIHAGHAFKPPSEHAMPSQNFYESRSSSQWTQIEDDELRKLVREYAYNWSLIANCLSSPSLFSSGAERRTPWECFERWITLEGLPVEMNKIGYFRAYHSRLAAAQRVYEAHQQALMQQQGNNPAQIPMRRRSTQPYSVERRKNAKHIHLVDAMRKQAKKRETALAKQQHVASLAAMRKATELPKAKQPMHTPQAFSRIKYERQLKVDENNKLIRQHAESQRQAQRQGVKPCQPVNGVHQGRSLVAGMPNSSSPNMTSNVPQIRGGGPTDPARSGPQMQRLMNSQTNGVTSTNGTGVPHAPMQPQMQLPVGQRAPPQVGPDLRIIQEAHRVHEQQAYLQQQRQQHQQQRHPHANGQISSPNMQNLTPLSQTNPNILASMQGRSSPSINGIQPINASTTSPRMNQSQALSGGMTPAVTQISNQVKLRNPQASPEQVTRMATEQLYRMSQQAAMAAAAGTANSAAVASNGLQNANHMQQQGMIANGGSPMLNPNQYSQFMRQQQASQQRSGSTGGGVGGSKSGTPLVQRPGSAQGSGRPSQSPRAGQVGVAGGQ